MNLQALANNPAEGKVVTLHYPDNTEESFDLPEMLQAVLAQQGFGTESANGWLHHAPSGYALLVQVLYVDLKSEDDVHCATTIQIHHPTLLPEGIFEYQYAVGKTPAEALNEGFRLWLASDWLVLLDAVAEEQGEYMRLEMTFDHTQPPLKRRISLGNVVYYYEYEPEVSDEANLCHCLFTHCLETFKSLLQDKRNYAIRLFASRDGMGQTNADCRVNGEAWAEGVEGIKAYAATWADAGFEFRKQYVVVRNIE